MLRENCFRKKWSFWDSKNFPGIQLKWPEKINPWLRFGKHDHLTNGVKVDGIWVISQNRESNLVSYVQMSQAPCPNHGDNWHRYDEHYGWTSYSELLVEEDVLKDNCKNSPCDSDVEKCVSFDEGYECIMHDHACPSGPAADLQDCIDAVFRRVVIFVQNFKAQNLDGCEHSSFFKSF